jgi:phosphoribosylglycinamide formyltransferase 1
MRVGVLCSHRAPALTYLLSNGRARTKAYEVALCITSEEAFSGEHAVRSAGIPLHFHPLRRYCREAGVPFTHAGVRARFDAETRASLTRYAIDLVVADSYLYQLTDPMLHRYERRIINLHHGDLTRRDPAGRPRFKGLRAVGDAILEGERETRATVHVVTHDLDDGPPFLRSWPFAVSSLAERAMRWDAVDILKAYVYAHQEWMIRATWGPLMEAALTLIADGRLDLDALSPDIADAEQVWCLDADGTIRPPEAEYAETAKKGTVPFSAVSTYIEAAVGGRA